jgi:hypothetical protein
MYYYTGLYYHHTLLFKNHHVEIPLDRQAITVMRFTRSIMECTGTKKVTCMQAQAMKKEMDLLHQPTHELNVMLS